MKSLLIGLMAACCLLYMPVRAQDELQPITNQNAHNLTRLEPIGRGRIEAMGWSPDGRWLAVQTPIGVWLSDGGAEPILLRVLDEPQAFAFSSDGAMLAVAGCRGYIPELFAQEGAVCEKSETHLWQLDALSGDAALMYMVDNGRSNIIDLIVGAAPFWNAPIVIANTGFSRLQVSNGWRIWELNLWHSLSSIGRMALSPDSGQLALIGHVNSGVRQGYTVYVLDMETYAMRGIRHSDPQLNVPQGIELSDIGFSDDGNTLIGIAPGGLWRWDLQQTRAEPVYEEYVQIPESFDTTRPIERSPNFQSGFTRVDNQNRLWTNPRLMLNESTPTDQSILLPDDNLTYYGFSPGSHYLIMGREANYEYGSSTAGELIPGLVRLYNTQTGSTAFEFSPAAVIHRSALSPDDTQIAYIDTDQRVHIYDLAAGREVNIISGFALETYGMAVMPDGRLVYSACAISVPAGNTSSCVPSTLHIGEQAFPKTGYATQAISPDGQWLVDRRLVFRDSRSGEIIREIEAESSRIWHLAFRPNEEQLAISGESPQLMWLDESGRESILLEIPMNEDGVIPWTPAVAYSPDGRLVATASHDGIGRLWDAESGALLAMMRSIESPRSEGQPSGDGVVFSPDGALVAFGACAVRDGSAASLCFDERVYVYNVNKALERGEMQPNDAELILAGAQDFTVSLIFSPDGSLIVGSTAPTGWESEPGRTITIWSAETGELLKILQAYGATQIAFSPDGKVLYANSSDGIVYRWGIR